MIGWSPDIMDERAAFGLSLALGASFGKKAKESDWSASQRSAVHELIVVRFG